MLLRLELLFLLFLLRSDAMASVLQSEEGGRGAGRPPRSLLCFDCIHRFEKLAAPRGSARSSRAERRGGHLAGSRVARPAKIAWILAGHRVASVGLQLAKVAAPLWPNPNSRDHTSIERILADRTAQRPLERQPRRFRNEDSLDLGTAAPCKVGGGPI